MTKELAISILIGDVLGTTEQTQEAVGMAVKALSEVFAQPQRIKGKWERKESELSWWYECSECGESPLYNPYADEVLTSFCPWCGAEMRGNEDDQS